MNDRESILHSELKRVDGDFGRPKHRKMAGNPFIFMRGSAQLFYRDLAAGVLNLPDELESLPLTAVMGDCHLSNFGFMTEEGSQGDAAIFSPNDFDDACIGHAGWDLLRFCTSLFLCQDYCRGLQAGDYDNSKLSPEELAQMRRLPLVTPSQAESAAGAFLQAYLKICAKSERKTDYHYRALTHFKSKHILHKPLKKALKRATGGKQFMQKSTLAKSVDLSETPLRFQHRPHKLKELAGEAREELAEVFSPYVDDQVLDAVQRLGAGTGSVNMERYYLLVGPEQLAARKAALESPELELCHIVEVKQQRRAAPLHHFPDLSPANRLNPAHLTARCQRLMQRRPDLVLDEVVWRNHHWLVRSRHHAAVDLDPEDLGLGKAAVKGGLGDYAAACGQALALAHIRGDRRSTRFEQAVGRVLPGCRAALLNEARHYAEQARKDCALLDRMLDKHS